jgi:hypothetical protein
VLAALVLDDVADRSAEHGSGERMAVVDQRSGRCADERPARPAVVMVLLNVAVMVVRMMRSGEQVSGGQEERQTDHCGLKLRFHIRAHLLFLQ